MTARTTFIVTLLLPREEPCRCAVCSQASVGPGGPVGPVAIRLRRMIPVEVAANAFVAAAIFLAGRNNVHTWWLGIVGCALFGWVFYHANLYADVTLQAFFIITSVYGWWRWLHGNRGLELPVRFSPPRLLA